MYLTSYPLDLVHQDQVTFFYLKEIVGFEIQAFLSLHWNSDRSNMSQNGFTIDRFRYSDSKFLKTTGFLSFVRENFDSFLLVKD